MIRNILLSMLLCSSSLIFADAQIIKKMSDLEKKLKSKNPVIIMCSGFHCGPCNQTKPHFHKVADEHQDIEFCIIDTNNKEFDELLEKTWKVMRIPTFIFRDNCEAVHRHTGPLSKTEIEEHVAIFRTKFKVKPVEKEIKSTKEKVSKKTKRVEKQAPSPKKRKKNRKHLDLTI